MLVHSEVDAVLYLLEDPDQEVFKHIKAKIISFGLEILPELDNIKENTQNSLVQKRISDIQHSIGYNNLCEDLNFWAQNNSDNLFKGISLICNYQYPGLNFEEFYFSILNIKHDVDFSIEGEKSPYTIINRINRIVFGDYGFRIVNKEGQAARHFYLNQLFKEKKGEVVMLSMLYAYLVAEMDLPIYMVKVPNNKCLFAFFNKYFDRTDPELSILTRPDIEKQILFYIDIARKGEILEKQDVQRRFFTEQQMTPSFETFVPLNNIAVILLFVENLCNFYEKNKINKQKLSQLNHLKEILLDHIF